MENENPLEERFRAEVTVNGQPLRESTGYGRYWRSEDGCCDEDADRVLEHYELERDCGWAIWRVCCLWNGGKLKPETVELTMTAEKEAVDGAHLRRSRQNSAADRPRTGLTHTLRVLF